MTRVAVVRFPGSNCDEDALRAADRAGASAHYVWHRDTELGQDLLNLGEDGVVAATRTPANFLVGDEIFLGELRGGGLAHVLRFPSVRRALGRHG